MPVCTSFRGRKYIRMMKLEEKEMGEIEKELEEKEIGEMEKE